MARIVTVSGPDVSPHHLELLRSHGYQVRLVSDDSDREELRNALSDAWGHVLGGNEYLDRELLAAASCLRVISYVGTGYSSFIDTAAAREFQIQTCSTPRLMVGAVVEHTIGLLIGAQRRLFERNSTLKSGGVCEDTSLELSRREIGIVGLGAIGEEVARVLVQGFRANVSYYSRTRHVRHEETLGVTYKSKDDLIKSSDVIILLIPSTEETRHFLGPREFNIMKKHVTLINTAGPWLVDADALLAALNADIVSTAAFDGFFSEPPYTGAEDTDRLLTLPRERVIVTGHTAARTPETWDRMLNKSIENLVAAEELDA
ncbi:2-hydroxyacid dehydrogenase [Ferruginivarius sediminum]|nr:NAD(P)-dependent oxidoreductase [Ferruginivarius sediminum]